MGKYDHLERDALIRLLERRDAERQLGWCGSATNWTRNPRRTRDFIALEQDVFMAGRRRGETEFLMLHKDGDKLDGDGPFALERMRWV